MNALFDSLAKALAREESRRTVLRRAAHGAWAFAVAPFGLARLANAKPNNDCTSFCTQLPPHQRDQCLQACLHCARGTISLCGRPGAFVCCPHGTACCETPCGGVCTDILSDPENCGRCGNVCPPGMICLNGACDCAPGTVGCGTAPSGGGPRICCPADATCCVSFNGNFAACCIPGATCCLSPDGNTATCCPPDFECVNGECVCPVSTFGCGTAPSGSGPRVCCPEGTTCCVSLDGNFAACCPPGTTCTSSGACV